MDLQYNHDMIWSKNLLLYHTFINALNVVKFINLLKPSRIINFKIKFSKKLKYIGKNETNYKTHSYSNLIETSFYGFIINIVKTQFQAKFMIHRTNTFDLN